MAEINTPTTEYANLALDDLFKLVFVCQQVSGDIKCAEARLQDRNKKWPALPPVTNKPYNDAASNQLGIFLLCRSIDIYNWYCRESLKLALSSNPQLVVDVIRKQNGRVADTVTKADKKGIDAASEVIREFLSDRYRGDRVIRETIHEKLNVLQNPEIELLCVCRNVLVHKRGHDEFGEIAAAIQKLGPNRALIGASWFPPDHMPIAIDASGFLTIDDAVGQWAAQLLQQQIFMMDQNFSHVYKLPRKVWPRSRIKRTFLGPSSGK